MSVTTRKGEKTGGVWARDSTTVRGLNWKESVSLESGHLGPALPVSAISDLFVPRVNKQRTVHKALLTPPLLVGIAACGQEPTGWRVEALVLRDLCGASHSPFPSLPLMSLGLWMPPRENLQWRSLSQHLDHVKLLN